MTEERIPVELSARKKELRSRMLERRAGLPPADRARASAAIQASVLSVPEVVDARSAFVFISHGSEVSTHRLLDELLDRGVRISVPKVVDSRRMAAVRFPGWDDLVPGALGIPSPPSSAPDPVAPDVVITPGLAFTPKGDRLGYGGGYYDRWFQEHPSPLRIAVTFDVQVLDSLPVHEGDMPVDLIVTEERAVRTDRR